jgi:signal peptidase I
MSSFSTGVVLCQGAIASGAPLRLRIRGTSMMPALWSGDSVSVHRANFDDVAPGEVVVFERNRYLVAHRVVRRIANPHGVLLVTRGDAQPDDDAPLDAAEFLGVVKSVRRGGASRALVREPSHLARSVAWVVRRSLLARSLLNRLNLHLRPQAVRCAQLLTLASAPLRSRA